MAINLPHFKLPALEANPIHSRTAIILFPYFCAFSLLFRGRKTFARVATRQQQKLSTVGWKFNVCFVFLIVTRGGIAALSLRSHSNDRKHRHKSLSLGTCSSLFEELVSCLAAVRRPRKCASRIGLTRKPLIDSSDPISTFIFGTIQPRLFLSFPRFSHEL